jgi:hypothetical protein
MVDVSAAAAVFDQIEPFQNLSGGAGCGPGSVVSASQPRDQLLGSPGGMTSTGVG